MKLRFFSAAVLAGFTHVLIAAPLTESTFTEVIKDVNVIADAGKTTAPAQVSALLKAPDMVRTGAGSRAELTAPDQTITRVGANTVFSFEPAGRAMKLEKGSVLFHSPTGKGGGTIKTGGASAAVLGTTIVVAATSDGGFKMIVLEGEGQAILPNGETIRLTAGQMVYIQPGGRRFGRVVTINLDRLTAGSQLLNGFPKQIPSQNRINGAVAKQKTAIAKGRARDTGIEADDFKSAPGPENGLATLDNNTLRAAVSQPMTIEQITGLLQGTARGVQGTGLVPVRGQP